MGQRGHCQSRGLYYFYGKGNENHQLQTGFFFFFHHRKVSRRVESVSDKMSYIVPRSMV